VVDTDGDGKRDYVDVDRDGLPDATETFDANNDGTLDVTPTGVDANGDGIDDAFVAITTPSSVPGFWRDSANGILSCATVSSATASAKTRSTAGKPPSRTKSFPNKAQPCGSGSQAQLKAAAGRSATAFNTLLAAQMGTTTRSCPLNVCTRTSTATTKQQMSALLKQMCSPQLTAKKLAMKFCGTGREDPDDKRKRSSDYLVVARRALTDLPSTLTSCPS